MASQSAPRVGLRATLGSRIDRLLERPLVRRLDPYIGVSELLRIHPLAAAVPIAVMAVLGARTSQFGHIDTVGGIFPVIAFISALNPVLGLLSGLAFGAADLLQKFVVDDIFYEGTRTTGDYWGARVGYVLTYFSMVVFGLLPGMLARVGGRLGEKVAGRTAARSANVADVSSGTHKVGRAAGRAAGAAVGALASGVWYQANGAAAFLLRPTADHSCYALARANVTGAMPGTMIAAAGGGGGSVLTGELGSDAAVSDGGGEKSEDKANCSDLMTRFQELSGRYAEERNKAEAAMRELNRAYARNRDMEDARRALIAEQQSAMAYLLGAGAIAGGVLASLGAAWCARVAAGFTQAAEGGAAAVEAAGVASPEYLALGRAALQAKIQAGAWQVTGARIAAEGVPVGAGLGAGAAGILESMMNKGMAEFEASAQNLERMVHEMEEVTKLKIHEARRSWNDLGDLRDRIRSKCNLDVSMPATEPPKMPARWGQGGGKISG